MKKILLALIVSASFSVSAEDKKEKKVDRDVQVKIEKDRIYQTNEYGEKRVNKPSYKKEGKCIAETNEFGEVRHNKPKYCFE